MRYKGYFRILACFLLVGILVFALTACAPKDSKALVKEVNNVMTKAGDVSIIDTITLRELKFALTDTPLGAVTATMSGGSIVLKREISGKNIDIEMNVSGIELSVSPSIADIAINADAFSDVTLLFNLSVKEESLIYSLTINGLDAVITGAKEKIEISNDAPMQLDKRAVEVIRLLVKQPLLGNYSDAGDYDKKSAKYSYSYSDNRIINNELTRAINMLIGLDIDKMKDIANFIENIFGSQNIEDIANEIITHDKYQVFATVKSGKYGHYFNTVQTDLISKMTLDNAKTIKLLRVMGMDSYLSNDSVTATASLNITANSEWSLKVN